MKKENATTDGQTVTLNQSDLDQFREKITIVQRLHSKAADLTKSVLIQAHNELLSFQYDCDDPNSDEDYLDINVIGASAVRGMVHALKDIVGLFGLTFEDPHLGAFFSPRRVPPTRERKVSRRPKTNRHRGHGRTAEAMMRRFEKLKRD